MRFPGVHLQTAPRGRLTIQSFKTALTEQRSFNLHCKSNCTGASEKPASKSVSLPLVWFSSLLKEILPRHHEITLWRRQNGNVSEIYSQGFAVPQFSFNHSLKLIESLTREHRLRKIPLETADIAPEDPIDRPDRRQYNLKISRVHTYQ